MIPLGLLFQTLMCFLEQHRPIPHLGQRYVQESCNTALSKKAPIWPSVNHEVITSFLMINNSIRRHLLYAICQELGKVL